MKEKDKCRLCDDRDETANCIISECRKLPQKKCMTGRKIDSLEVVEDNKF